MENGMGAPKETFVLPRAPDLSHTNKDAHTENLSLIVVNIYYAQLNMTQG